MYKQAENDAWSDEYCSSHFLKEFPTEAHSTGLFWFSDVCDHG